MKRLIVLLVLLCSSCSWVKPETTFVDNKPVCTEKWAFTDFFTSAALLTSGVVLTENTQVFDSFAAEKITIPTVMLTGTTFMFSAISGFNSYNECEKAHGGVDDAE